MTTYDYLVYIGRFQPFHNGHKYIVDRALTLAKNILIICGTSSEISAKNPWRYDQVKRMIEDCYDQDSLLIESLQDIADDDRWLHNLLQIIDRDTKGKVGIIGHHKDQSSYYLDLLPEFEYIEVDNYGNINATNIRDFLTRGDLESVKDLVPPNIYSFITKSQKPAISINNTNIRN